MDTALKGVYSIGALLASSSAAVGLDGWVSAIGSLGGFGVLIYAVAYTMRLLHRKDEIITARDTQIWELTQQLINNCKNCDLAKAANKELIEK